MKDSLGISRLGDMTGTFRRGLTGRFAAVFGDQRLGSDTPGECMPMAAMRAEYRVALPEMSAYADGNRLLPDIRVTRAQDETTLMQTRQLLLRTADAKHLPVKH